MMPVISARLADIRTDGITRGREFTSPMLIEAQGIGCVGSDAVSALFLGEKLGRGIHGMDSKQVNLDSLSRCPVSHAKDLCNPGSKG